MPNYWLFKTEPDEYSIDDLRHQQHTIWDGIRNYQARNRLRDEVRLGDEVLIYHSSCASPAIVGLAEVSQTAQPDASQFDSQSPYFDAKSSIDAPRWVQIELKYRDTFSNPLSLKAIKSNPELLKQLEHMELINRGRLSIQKVDCNAFKLISEICQGQKTA